MSKLKCQVVRDGAQKWMIWKIGDQFKVDGGTGAEYEQVARIVCDGGLYFVEEPIWGTDGIDEWKRLPRGWLTKDGAQHSVLFPKKAMAS